MTFCAALHSSVLHLISYAWVSARRRRSSSACASASVRPIKVSFADIQRVCSSYSLLGAAFSDVNTRPRISKDDVHRLERRLLRELGLGGCVRGRTGPKSPDLSFTARVAAIMGNTTVAAMPALDTMRGMMGVMMVAAVGIAVEVEAVTSAQ